MMGFMDEYNRGRDWIINSFNIDVNSDVSAFEVNIRFIGGLLSLYTLTKDKIYLDKAELVATKLLPAFETETGIPYALVNPITKKVKNYNWASGTCSILSEFGTLSLEFQYLSDLTGNKIFAQKIDKIFSVLYKVEKENGLYYNYLNQHTGKWCMKHASMGALADSFYEYLLKYWLYKNKSDTNLLNMYLNSMKSIQTHLMATTANTNLTYFGEYKSNRLDKKMDHLACFSGGLMALTSQTVDSLNEQEKSKYFQLAKQITHTCHESYIRTPSHIGPEAFHFERTDQEAFAIKNEEKYYILRPEVIESYFYLWRFTKNEMYRDWAWDFVESLEKYCKTDNGYSGLKDVYDPIGGGKDDVQQSFLFAETFKYLFLIFSDDHILPLDKYVLNTEAHLILINKK
jgi:mannosyl-oligosaccharide alpha-1,2-mannosidase